ncbi:MAG: sensor histidine kinase, partial [Saprospiraceae bacterium]|nr:sensor histidine kinase [Saprospiraceae bacterium]
LDKAFDLFTDLGNKDGLIDVYHGYADINHFLGHNLDATLNYQKGLELAQEIGDTLRTINLSRRNAITITQTGNYRKSNNILFDLLKKAEDHGLTIQQGDILNGIATNYDELIMPDSGLHYLRLACAKFEEGNDPEGIAMALTNLARDQLDVGLLENAFDTLRAARIILDTIFNLSLETNYYLSLGYYHFLKNQFVEAEVEVLKSLELINEFSYKLEQRYIFDLLVKISKQKGDYQKAVFYHEGLMRIKDSLLYQNINRQVDDLQIKYETAQKDSEIATQQLQITQRTSQRNLFMLGAGTLLLLTWFLYYRNRKNKILSTAKIENLEKQQKLMAMDYMVQGQEEERKRIAQDLHDGLGGLLASARIQMQKIQGEIKNFANINLFNQAEKLIYNAHIEVRRIAHDMMPGALIDLGLMDAIEDLAAKTRKEHSIIVNLSKPSADLHLTEPQSVNLYRIIQEILTNTIKHADASRISISIAVDGDLMKLTISDDGKGFNYVKAFKKEGLGLPSIVSRVKYLEGEVHVETSEGKGTVYQVEVPL